MEKSMQQVVPLFVGGFELCKAVLETGEIDIQDPSVLTRVPDGITLAPGGFAVFIKQEDLERISWAEEWQEGIAILEPVKGPPKAGEAYLYGKYDARHHWLDGACVDRAAAILEGKMIYMLDGKAETVSLGENLFVGRLVAVEPLAKRSE